MSQEALIQAALGAKFAAMAEAQPPTIADSVMQTPTPVVADAEKTYVHTLEDGREVAGTLEQARMLCPVIGAMSVESAQATLNDADFAQRIAERGRLQREVSEQEKPLADKPPVNKVVVEAKETKPVSQKPAETVPLAKTHAQIPLSPPGSHVTATKLRRMVPSSEALQAAQTANYNASLGLAQSDSVINKSTITTNSVAKLKTKPSSASQTHITIQPEKPAVIAHAKTIKKTDLNLVSVKPRSEKPAKVTKSALAVKTVTQKTPQVVNRVGKDAFKPKAEIIVPTRIRTIQAEASLTMQVATNDAQESEYSTPSPYELHILDGIADNGRQAYSSESEIAADTIFNAAMEVMSEEVTLAVNSVAQPEIQDYFDEEIIQTYEQLLYLIDGGSNLVEATIAEEVIFASTAVTVAEQTTEENTPALADNILPEAVAKNIMFEDFILLQPKPEKTVELEEIVAGASEQSLEETLVQVCSYLAEVDVHAADSSLHQALSDLAAFLPLKNSLASPQEIYIFPTPGMTEKLLILLKTIGYPHPHETLVAFIKKHGWEFLLQALWHLYKLSDPDNQQEFSYAAPASASIGLTHKWGMRSIAVVITKLLVKPHIELLLMPQTEHKLL